MDQLLYIVSPDSTCFSFTPSPNATLETLKQRIIGDRPKTKNQIFRFVSNGLFLHEETSLQLLAQQKHPVIVSILFPIKLEIDSKIHQFNLYSNTPISQLTKIVINQSPDHKNDQIIFKVNGRELNVKSDIFDSVQPNEIINCFFISTNDIKTKSVFSKRREEQRQKEAKEQEQLNTLTSMDFKPEQAKAALFLASNNIDLAIDYLVKGKVQKKLDLIQDPKNLWEGNKEDIKLAVFLNQDIAFDFMAEYYEEEQNPEIVLSAPEFVHEHFGEDIGIDWETFYLKSCHNEMIQYGDYGDLINKENFSDINWLYSFIVKASKLSWGPQIFYRPISFLAEVLPGISFKDLDFEIMKSYMIEDKYIKPNEGPIIDADIEHNLELEKEKEFEVDDYYRSYYHSNEEEDYDYDEGFRHHSDGGYSDDSDDGEHRHPINLSLLRGLFSLLSGNL